MREYKCARGHTLLLGNRGGPNGEDDNRCISWNDPKTGSWDAQSNNEAGSIVMPGSFDPNTSIREDPDGSLIIGETYRLKALPQPYIWGVEKLAEAT
jgi:hypothetical protein